MHLALPASVNRHLAFKPLRQSVQGVLRIALYKQLTGVSAALRQGVGINSVQGLGQFELVAQRFIAAQTRAHHQHRITLRVEVFGGLLQVVRTQAGRVIFSQNATPLHRRYNAPAQSHETFDSRAGHAGTATQPQQGSLGNLQTAGQFVNLDAGRLNHGKRRAAKVLWQIDEAGLHVDRNFNTDRAARRCLRDTHRLTQSGQCRGGIANAKGGFAHRLQHGHLGGGFVNEAQVAVQEFRFDLARQMQHRGAGGDGFNQRAGSIASTGASAGDTHAQVAGDTRIGICHVAGTGLTACRYEPDRQRLMAARVEGIQNRHVVDGDHAKGRAGAALLQKTHGQFTHGDLLTGGNGGRGVGCTHANSLSGLAREKREGVAFAMPGRA